MGHVTFEDETPTPRKPMLKRKESGIFSPISEERGCRNSNIIIEKSDEESVDYIIESEDGQVSIFTPGSKFRKSPEG